MRSIITKKENPWARGTPIVDEVELVDAPPASSANAVSSVSPTSVASFVSPTSVASSVSPAQAKSSLVAEVGEKTDSAENTPPEYMKEELLPMLDDLLIKGYVVTEFSIRATKVVLRSRFAAEDNLIFSGIDKLKLETAIAYQQRFTLLSLAASLVVYGDTMFDIVNKDTKKMEESFRERIEFVESLPTVITDILYMKWHEFNQKQGYIVNNLDALIKDF